MTGERRYDEREIGEILDRATTVNDARRGSSDHADLTLGQLEEIGREVGIDPGRIADAARVLEGKPGVGGRYLGAARTVSRVVPLDRAPSEQEWSRMVTRLREVFSVAGRLEGTGAVRSWIQGEVRVDVEPAEEGCVVRVSAERTGVRQFTTVGVLFLIMSSVIALGAGLGVTDDTFAMAALFALIGTGSITWMRATLPGWARTRTSQLDEIAAEVVESLDSRLTRDR